MEELKLCPFCGGKSYEKYYHHTIKKNTEKYFYLIGCENCKFNIETESIYGIKKAHQEAIEAWNKSYYEKQA